MIKNLIKMKNLLKIFTLIILGILVVSCEKDEDQAILSEASKSTLSVDKNTIILSEIIADPPALNFTWVKPTFNVAVVPSYQIEFSLKDNNFKKSEIFDLDASVTTGAITHASLNTIMFKLGANLDVVNQVDARLKTNVGTASFYSNVIVIAVTPYTPNPDLVYPKINVPGGYAPAAGYSDWDPANTANLFSPEKDDKYRGFINIAAPNSEYKFTINQNWAGDKGDDGTLMGKLVETGEQNIKAVLPGAYYLKVDWVGNTYSTMLANFGIIGDATPTGWNSDTDFVYNPTTKTYVINSIALNNSGIFKFRANDDWALKFQPENGDQTLVSGPGIKTFFSAEGTVTGDPNYKVSVAGNYKIGLARHSSAFYTLTRPPL